MSQYCSHTTERQGELKTESLKESLTSLNPDPQVETINHSPDDEDLEALLPGLDALLDCSDNAATRLQLNRWSKRAAIPLISGAAIRFEGQLLTLRHDLKDQTLPCYQCFYGADDSDGDSCAMLGVAGPVVGTIGVLQALEAIKIVSGAGDVPGNKLLVFDGLAMEWQTLNLQRDKNCAVCREKASHSTQTRIGS